MSLDTSSNMHLISINQPCCKEDINAAQKLCQVIVLSTPMTSCAAPQPLRKLWLHMPFLRHVSSFHDFIIQYAKKKIIVNHATCSTMLFHNVWYHVLIIVITRKYIVDNHVISYHIHVTMMGALDQYSCWNDASFHASPCSISLFCILRTSYGVRVLGFELCVQWHRHISLSAASNEFCKFVSLKSCEIWRSNTSKWWCWAHLEWAKKEKC